LYGQHTWRPGSGPLAIGAGGRRLGRFVFAARSDASDEVVDVAIILVDRKVATSPQVCHFGGPVGLNNERGTDPATLEFYGQADLVGSVVPARSGFTIDTRNPDYVHAWAPIGYGDSGGPWLTDDGRALGYLTHVLPYSTSVEQTGTALVRRLGPQIEAAERGLGMKLELVRAPRLP
jgi:hypothetical protein